MMIRANQELKEQVALKTSQLSHQSRILLTNNHQLRKQLQVRRLIFSQSVNSLKDRVQKYDIGLRHDSQEVLKLLTGELELLLNVREVDGEALPVYNLTLIISSVLRGWQEEFIKAGISVRIPTDEEVYIKLSHFNLDELFTVLFDGIIKRSYRNQTIHGQIVTYNGKVSLRITDEGDAISSPVLSDTSIQNLGRLAEQSGGEMAYHSSSERNLIELVWPEGETFDDRSVVELTDATAQEQSTEQDPWLDKVRALVAEHFSDANFGTASAAKMMFVSERSLQRRLKNSIKKTFTEYLTEVRLDHACQRLLAGAKISDVAFDCGFNDPSYFSQRFKHRFGMSPTQFIEGHEA
jgi:AraC family chitin signaling transcriptional activator